MESIVAQIPNEAQIALRGLKVQLRAYALLPDNFLLTIRSRATTNIAGSRNARHRYATYAYKAFPSTGRVLTLALLGGMALGVGFGMLANFWTERSERVGSTSRASVGVPGVGSAG